MEKCNPFNEFKYRLFEDYFGKFDDTHALCDFYDLEEAHRVMNILKEYYKNRPFEFYLKEIEYANK